MVQESTELDSSLSQLHPRRCLHTQYWIPKRKYDISRCPFHHHRVVLNEQRVLKTRLIFSVSICPQCLKNFLKASAKKSLRLHYLVWIVCYLVLSCYHTPRLKNMTAVASHDERSWRFEEIDEITNKRKLLSKSTSNCIVSGGSVGSSYLGSTGTYVKLQING